MDDDLRGQAVQDPFMPESLFALHPFFWVPNEALFQEIEEEGVLALDYVFDIFGEGVSLLSAAVRLDDGLELCVEEQIEPLSFLLDLRPGDSNQLHEISDLVFFVFPRKQGHSTLQLSQYAGHRPHIDRMSVRYP